MIGTIILCAGSFILCLFTNLPVIVSCNSILNGLEYFFDVLYICICDIVREET